MGNVEEYMKALVRDTVEDSTHCNSPAMIGQTLADHAPSLRS